MKQATTIVSLALLLTAQQAEAGAPGDITTLQFSDPATAQCVAQCVAGTSECLKPPVPQAAPKKVVKRRRVRRVRRKSCCEILKAEIKKIKAELGDLELSVGLLKKKGTYQDKRLAWVDQQLVYLNKWPLRIVGLEKETRQLKKRLAQVERFQTPIRLSATAGFSGFYATDGSGYTGGLVGVRIATSLSTNVELGVEPLVALAVNERPLGTMVRGYLGFTGLANCLSLETGASALWAGYNSQADAKAAYFTGDLGVTAFQQGLWVSFRVHAGIESDQDSPAFAVGGVLLAGYEF